MAPHYAERRALLERLTKDEGILQIMAKDGRDLSCGNLTELHPHTQSDLLGLNENSGQQISLRVLTDDLSGCRSVRFPRLLLHTQPKV